MEGCQAAKREKAVVHSIAETGVCHKNNMERILGMTEKEKIATASKRRLYTGALLAATYALICARKYLSQ